jgi:hypothetical protein
MRRVWANASPSCHAAHAPLLCRHVQYTAPRFPESCAGGPAVSCGIQWCKEQRTPALTATASQCCAFVQLYWCGVFSLQDRAVLSATSMFMYFHLLPLKAVCCIMDSLYVFKCKRFRNTRPTVTFGLPLWRAFWNTLHYQWKPHWTVTIPGKTRCVFCYIMRVQNTVHVP